VAPVHQSVGGQHIFLNLSHFTPLVLEQPREKESGLKKFKERINGHYLC